MSGILKALSAGLCVVGILLLSGCPSNDSAQKRPNILLILTDDLGNNDIASWGDGSAPTPTLDQLSREAIRFRQHYTDSTCSPSRAALMTGQHPIRVGFQPDGVGLSKDLNTLPKSLHKLGYRTAHIGKWHLGEALEYPEIQPGNQGFDYWFGMLNHFVLGGPGPHGEIIQGKPTHLNPWLQENGLPPKRYQGYLDDILVQSAIAQMSDTQQPWFINLWLFSPHAPYQAAPRFATAFPDTEEGHFLSMLKQLDVHVASLLDALKSKGLLENTIVIFASDNGGPNIARDNNYPLQGKKVEYTDGGVRSPLLVYWPSQLTSRDISAPTHIADIYPTLMRLVGGEPPQNIMGRDLTPLLHGQSMAMPERFAWAVDLGPWGMVYGAHLFGSGTFFAQNLWSGFVSGNTYLPIGSPMPPTQKVVPPSQEQASAQMTPVEALLRLPPFTWNAQVHHQQGHGFGQLTGLDFQRAPIFGGYSLGLSIDAAGARPQGTLLAQAGVWQIDWMPDQRLRIQVGSVEHWTQPIQSILPGCNKLVVSVFIKPAATTPFVTQAATSLAVYWNQQAILRSTQILSRPQSAEVLKNPTWIGVNAAGDQAFSGSILGRPLIVNKFLSASQAGYKLQDLQTQLCVGNLPE